MFIKKKVWIFWAFNTILIYWYLVYMDCVQICVCDIRLLEDCPKVKETGKTSSLPLNAFIYTLWLGLLYYIIS